LEKFRFEQKKQNKEGGKKGTERDYGERKGKKIISAFDRGGGATKIRKDTAKGPRIKNIIGFLPRGLGRRAGQQGVKKTRSIRLVERGGLRLALHSVGRGVARKMFDQKKACGGASSRKGASFRH